MKSPQQQEAEAFNRIASKKKTDSTQDMVTVPKTGVDSEKNVTI